MERNEILAKIGGGDLRVREDHGGIMSSAHFRKTPDFHDIDVALLISDLPSYQRIKFALKVAGELERSRRTTSGFDIKILNSSPIYFRHESVRTGVLVFNRDREKREEYEAHLVNLATFS